MKWKSLSIILLALATCCSCQENIVHRYCAVDSQNWHPSYKARFHITDIKEKGNYQMTAEVRLDKHYPYRELWLVVETETSRGAHYSDTLCMDVVGEAGQLDGEGRNIMTYTAPVRKIPLQETDTVDICIHHCLSNASVPGVHDVGFLLEPSTSTFSRFSKSKPQ